jgi:hypothetical protein
MYFFYQIGKRCFPLPDQIVKVSTGEYSEIFFFLVSRASENFTAFVSREGFPEKVKHLRTEIFIIE